MGCWSVYCGISNITIGASEECAIVPLAPNKNYFSSFGYHSWYLASPPIWGKYNDYGGIEDIVEDDHTKIIESTFGVTIEEFCGHLTRSVAYHDSDESIEDRATNFDVMKDWNFMWIDKEVYDTLTSGAKGQYDSEDKSKPSFKHRLYNSFGFDSIDVDSVELYNHNIASWESIPDSEKKQNAMELLKKMSAHSNIPSLMISYMQQPVLLERLKFESYCWDMILNQLYPLSWTIRPHYTHITPQCPEHEDHLKLLKQFIKILKSRI